MHSWKIKILGYLQGAWRYRWYGVALAWAVCIGGWAFVATIPDRYQVAAKVFVDTDSLMGPLLKGLVVNQDPAQQIPIMLNRLITRPNIEQVIRLTRPQESAAYSAVRMEDEITKIQREVGIKPAGAKNLYSVSYTDADNRHAVAVTQTLLSILVDSNIGDKRRDSQQAQTFIDKRIEEYADLLRQAEKRRADFRQNNIDITARGGGAERLDAATAALSRMNEELSSATTRRDTLRQQLAGTPKTVPASAATTVLIGPNGNGNATASLEALRGTPAQMLEQAKTQLSQLLLKYTPVHPDVIALQRTIGRLTDEVAKSEGQTSTEDATPTGEPTIPNPVYVQLRSRLAEEEVGLAVARHRVDMAAAEVASARANIGKALELERQRADLDRDYDVISANYQSLVKSREAARMGQAVTDEQSQIAFDVIEPPVEATAPVSPKRALLNLGILFVGIAGGGALAFLMSLIADKFIISADLADRFGLPIIGVVTWLHQGASRREELRSALALSASVAGLVVVFGGVVLFGQYSMLNFVGG